jgi:alpha-L-arabinofuranosidase
VHRRDFLLGAAGTAAGMLGASAAALAGAQGSRSEQGQLIAVDPRPLFDFSPLFYMQFMEPLGATDASVEAAWSYEEDDWRGDFIQATRELSPDVVRFGGLLSRYYKWREGTGPPALRPWMRNYVWGGKETNRVGTHEFVDFCRRVGAAPLYCVNFRSDGDARYSTTPEGDRSGDAQEAADWVSYANDPDHPLRRAHGHPEPYDIKLWQIGNETSYGRETFAKDQAMRATVEFAGAMRARDPGLQLIGWGDDGWAYDLVQRAGEHLDWVAVHMMQQRPLRKDTVLDSLAYQRDPPRAWEELMEMVPARVERKLLALEAQLDAAKASHPIAITEGHLSLAPRNVNPILAEWLTGVYDARVLNLYHRHGARVRMCTGADFNGTRWTTNALIHQVPRGRTYMLPAAAVAALFKQHQGSLGIATPSAPPALDIAASRTGDAIFLHVANTRYGEAVSAQFAVEGMAIVDAEVFSIAPEDPRAAATELTPDAFQPQHTRVAPEPEVHWRFAPRSVNAVVLHCTPA